MTVAASELVEQALAVAILPVVAIVTEQTEANLRWASNALTTNGEMTSRTLTVVATATTSNDGVDGAATGTVSQQVSGSDAAAVADQVAAIVAAAEQAARSAPASPDAALPVTAPDGSPGDPDWTREPEQTSIEVLARVAQGLGVAFTDATAAGVELFGFAEHILTTTYLGSTAGLRRRGVQPTGRLEFNAKSEAGGSAWVGAATETFADVDIATLYAELTRRLDWGRTVIELPPGRYETLLPPGPLADLMIYAHWTASAQDAEDGRNVYAAPGGRTRIGQRLSPLPITLRSDPHDPRVRAVDFVESAGSEDGTSFAFDLGLDVPAVDWIRDGVLTDLIRNRARAERSGLRATPAADNLIMDAGGTATLEEMIAATERGLLITCFWYIREVDPERLLLTGLTRDGVYLIEGGQVVGRVNNFRWNESPVELLGRISEIGVSEHVLCREWNDFFNRTVMPSVRIPDFFMSTVSQAS